MSFESFQALFLAISHVPVLWWIRLHHLLFKTKKHLLASATLPVKLRRQQILDV